MNLKMNIIVNDEYVNFKNMTVFADTETAPRNGIKGLGGLYGPVRLVQFYCPELDPLSVYIYDTREYPLILAKKRLREAKKTIWHNGKYDFDCLDFMPSEWEDTIILDQNINYRAEKHGLDDVAIRVFKTDVYHDMFNGKMDVTLELKGTTHTVDFDLDVVYDKKKMQRSDWGGVVTRTMYAYAALDVWILPEILESFGDLESAGWNYKLDKSTVIAFTKMGQKLPIDVKGLKLHLKANNETIAEYNMPININSYQQVRPYISGLPKAEAIATVGSGDDDLATMCAEGNEKACAVRTVRSLKKQNSFITKFLDEKTDDDYIHGHLNIGTRSGRSKCSSMNLQQIPQAFKKYIKVHPGKFMVYSDFAQLELRSLCVLIGEPTLEKLFRSGGDIHNYTRDALFDKDTQVSDAGRGNSLRQIAKIYNFASMAQLKPIELTGNLSAAA